MCCGRENKYKCEIRPHSLVNHHMNAITFILLLKIHIHTTYAHLAQHVGKVSRSNKPQFCPKETFPYPTVAFREKELHSQ